MKMNKKGFTLVELLAVIVVLAVILVIAIPNVLSIIDKSRKDSMASTAKMMVKAAQLAIAQGVLADGTTAIVSPATSGTAITLPMGKLGLDNTTKDADGANYGANSYVLVVNYSGNLTYYAFVHGSKRYISGVKSDEITAATVQSTTAPVAATTTASTYLYDGVGTATYRIANYTNGVLYNNTNTVAVNGGNCGSTANCTAITVSTVY